jgi:hypothetical protein
VLNNTHVACCGVQNITVVNLPDTLSKKERQEAEAVLELCSWSEGQFKQASLDYSCGDYEEFRENLFSIINPKLKSFGIYAIVIAVATLLTLIFTCCLACNVPRKDGADGTYARGYESAPVQGVAVAY